MREGPKRLSHTTNAAKKAHATTATATEPEVRARAVDVNATTPDATSAAMRTMPAASAGPPCSSQDRVYPGPSSRSLDQGGARRGMTGEITRRRPSATSIEATAPVSSLLSP